MNRLKVLIPLLVVLSLAACQKEQVVEGSQIANASLNSKDWNKTVMNVAKDVSKKLRSEAFRKMLKHEVALRFDGDANILISSIVKRLPKYLAFEKTHQASNLVSNGDLLSSFDFDILQQAALDFPQMQLAVQTDAESWDAINFVPKVVYLTTDYDEATHTSVNGFDENQQPISVSTEYDPVDNYVVVSENERTVLRQGDVIRLLVSECPVSYLIDEAIYNPDLLPAPIEPCTGGGGTGGGGTGAGGTPQPGSGYIQYVGTGQDGVLPTLLGRQIGAIVPSPTNGTFNVLGPVGTFNGTTVYRTDYRHEKMRFIRCDNLGQIEGWPAGAPEIRLVTFEQNVNNPSENLQIFKEQMEPRKRMHINGQWWDAGGVTMHLWDYQGTGTKCGFAYYEYDPVLIPNEALVSIGQITVDILAITGIVPTSNPTQVTIYGNIRNSVATGIRALKKKNGLSEYIGADDYSIFNNQDQFNHSPGGTKFQTWPDL